ncbi:MAG: hypothetical protein GY796_23035, partial [Chloroflexi bacterium]|nr:hypothetical protein [Chloroflexota bacterium]
MEESIADLKPPSWQSWGGRILILLFAFWIINIVWLAQTAVWFIIGSGESDTVWSWMWATIIQALF